MLPSRAREDRSYDPGAVKRKEEFQCVRAARQGGGEREREERAAVKTLERFHYSERGSKTRGERPAVGDFKGFSALASLLHKSREVDTKMRIYFYNGPLSRACPLKVRETRLNTRVSIFLRLRP